MAFTFASRKFWLLWSPFLSVGAIRAAAIGRVPENDKFFLLIMKGERESQRRLKAGRGDRVVRDDAGSWDLGN